MNFKATYLFIFFILLIGCEEKQKSAEDKSGFIEINGTQHYFNTVGKGDTIIVLHGGPGFSHKYLKPQLDSLLSSYFTLLYYDQRGSGWSEGENDTSRLNIESFVQDLEQIRNHFNLKKLNLLGHSFGGLLAMFYSIEYPNKVSSLILVDSDAASYALRTPYQIKTINSRLSTSQQVYLDSIEQTDRFISYDPDSYEVYYKSYLTTYFANPADTAKLILGFDAKNVPKINTTNSIVRANLGQYDIHSKLPNITCRTLIMQGTKSVFSVEGAMAIKQHIKNSDLQLFENCGHFEYIESPAKFKRLILDFYAIK